MVVDGVDTTCIYLPPKAATHLTTRCCSAYTATRGPRAVLRKTLATVDPSIEFDVRTMAEVWISITALQAGVMGCCDPWCAWPDAGFDWYLWCYGVYVSQRTKRIGIRMALGADGNRVLWMNLREGLRSSPLPPAGDWLWLSHSRK